MNNTTVNRLMVISKKVPSGCTLYWHRGRMGEDVWGGLDNALSFVAPHCFTSKEGTEIVRLVDVAMFG